jgi:hypothetical protein
MKTAYLVMHLGVEDTLSADWQDPEFSNIRIYSEFPAECRIREVVQAVLSEVSAESYQEAHDLMLRGISAPTSTLAWVIPHLTVEDARACRILRREFAERAREEA